MVPPRLPPREAAAVPVVLKADVNDRVGTSVVVAVVIIMAAAAAMDAAAIVGFIFLLFDSRKYHRDAASKQPWLWPIMMLCVKGDKNAVFWPVVRPSCVMPKRHIGLSVHHHNRREEDNDVAGTFSRKGRWRTETKERERETRSREQKAKKGRTAKATTTMMMWCPTE